MSVPLVSVIIPTYNSARSLPQAVESLRWQTHSRWECIIVDDGSTDDTRVIAERFLRGDSRFRYHHQENKGLGAARNAGLALAQGEFIQFLDADDLLLPDKLDKCIQSLSHDDTTQVAYTEYVCLSGDSDFFQLLPAQFQSDDSLHSFLFGWDVDFIIPVHSFLFKRGVFSVEQFTTDLNSREDVDCWIRLALRNVRFRYLDYVGVVYRLGANSMTSGERSMIVTKTHVLEKYRAHPACRLYGEEFERAFLTLRQRLAIAFFMEKKFTDGWKTMLSVWKNSSSSSRLKMMVWCLLLAVFTKDFVARTRHLVIRFTPIRWGGWSAYRRWRPPAELRELLRRT